MAGCHIGLEHDQRLVDGAVRSLRLCRGDACADTRHPLCSLIVTDPVVGEASRRKDGGEAIARLGEKVFDEPAVLVRAVRAHVLEIKLVPWIAPFLELARRQRQLSIEHRVQDGHKGHVCDDGLEERGPHVEACADEHATRRATDDGHVARRRVLLVSELVSHRDKVEKGAPLAEEFGRLVPRLAQVAASPYVRGGHDKAEVGVERVRVAPHRLLADPV
mmetsp:Transcript_68897/g.153752  ORF Transcript_68897/g.153752 Transcript_68897/m.153752 type:complete len:219 (-) Transcript_68897:456-1112(-)